MARPLDVHRLPRAAARSSSQQRAVEEFWRRRQEDIEATVDFSEREIPMARLKKLICTQKGSMMITFDTPAFLSKACELFVQELTIRAWTCAESHHRCIILDSDVAEAIAATESYGFLIDVLHAHWAEHNPTPRRPRPTRKRPRPTDQPSTPRHPPHQHQVRQFAGCAPHIPIPPSLEPTAAHHMPLSSPFLLQEALSLLATTVTSTPTVNGPMPPTNCITRVPDLPRNNINTTSNNNALVSTVAGNNSIVAAAMTPLPGPAGGLPNIPNTHFYMNTVNMMDMGNGGEKGGLAFKPLLPLQFSCALSMANNNDYVVATTIELKQILPEGVETNSNVHASGTSNGNGDIDDDGAIDVDDGQLQQQEKETNDHHRNVVHESVDVETIVVAGVGGNKYNINGDEVEIVDDSLLDKFLEDIQISEDLLSPGTTPDDLLPLISTILDVEEFINDPYVLDGVFSNPSTSTNIN